MLTSLELFGFKSFADRTLFEFSPGITCVVGPNGSGKSNVVDAMKWLLGDQSPKSLRGKEMSDVIFNGSSGRKPSGFAEATLTFDNSSGLLAIDAREVRVGRRLYVGGDSEYLLNGATVRLKDVRDVFMGTGAGTAAYSIIEQGRVDQILQANPTARRVVFEEAAGISRYKARKVDAERKLEKVAQNLQRLTDIVDEVEARLTATRSQASKAAKFRELTNEFRELWTGLAADDDRHLVRDLDLLETEEKTRQERLESLAEEIQTLEAEKGALDGELSRLDEIVRSEERRVAAVREQVVAHEAAIRHQSQREMELESEVERLRIDRLSLAAQSAAVERDLVETAAQLESFQTRLTEHQEQIHRQEAECAEHERTILTLKAENGRRERTREEHRATLSDDERRAARLQSQIEHQETRALQIAAQVDETRAQRQEAIEEQTRRQEQVLTVENRHSQILEKLAEAYGTRETLLKEQTSLDESQSRRRERRSAAVARIHVLEDFEKQQEGVSVGVREILHRAHDSPHSPWNEVLGTVSDLLHVTLEHAPLLEIALGSRSQLVVVKRLGPLIDWLNKQSAPLAGRVGFLELRSPAEKPSVLDPPLATTPGVICRADALAEPIPEAAGLATLLLADTWVVEGLDLARSLHRASPHLRFVTLQGELVDRDGTVHAGSVPNTTAVVSRRSELRSLKHEIIRLDRELEAGEERAAEIVEELERQTAALAEREQHSRGALEQLAEARSRVDQQQREVERLGESLIQIERQQEEALAQLEPLKAGHEEALAAIASGRRLIEEDTREITRGESSIRDISAQLSSIKDDLRRRQLELATHQERCTNLQSSLRRLQDEQHERRTRKEQAGRHLAEVQRSVRECRLTILRTRALLDSAIGSVEELSRSASQQIVRRREVRGRWSAVSKTEEELHKTRREQLDQQHQAELRLREIRQQRAQLEERTREDFQLELAEVVAAGASAFRKLVIERFGGEPAPAVSAQLIESSGSDRMPEACATEGPRTLEAYATASSIDDVYAIAPVPFVELRGEIEEAANRLRRKIKLMGSVNTEALGELDDLESRFSHLSAQHQDLQEARNTLEDIIRRINRESRKMFIETFEAIRGHFRELYRKLFGGGEADILLEDPEDVLECGIEVVARPPGKELRSISLLSGGEKTMTAVALLFAMFKTKPSPYCILDEVDAALDEANVDRYVAVVQEFAEKTQFVIITHRKRTMTAANVLYGVTMEQAGVSKRLSVRFEDVSDDGNFKTRAAA